MAVKFTIDKGGSTASKRQQIANDRTRRLMQKDKAASSGPAKSGFEKAIDTGLDVARTVSESPLRMLSPAAMMAGGAADIITSGSDILSGDADAFDFLTLGAFALPPVAGAGIKGAKAALNATKPAADLSRAYNQLAKTLARPQVTHMTDLKALEGMIGSGGQLKTAASGAVSPSQASAGDFTVRNLVAPDDPIYGAFIRGNPNVTFNPSSMPAYATKSSQDARRATQITQGVPDNPLLDYGDIGINFNPQVSRASTATLGDSVGWSPTVARAEGGADFAATQRLSPGASADQIRDAARTAGVEDLRSPFFGRSLPYLEAQIPRELATLQNAKSISVTSPEQARIVSNLLKEAGINTKVVVRKTKNETEPLVSRAIEALANASKQMGYRKDALQQRLRTARNQDKIIEPEA